MGNSLLDGRLLRQLGVECGDVVYHNQVLVEAFEDLRHPRLQIVEDQRLMALLKVHHHGGNNLGGGEVRSIDVGTVDDHGQCGLHTLFIDHLAHKLH